MKRIGLMGCGTVAGYGHLPALRDTKGLTTHALFDPDETRLHAMQQRFGVSHAFTDVEAFLSSGIDAVTITSPAPCHRQNVADAARHGLPILCEKPLAMTEDEAAEMIATAERAGVMLFTGFDYRFSPVSQKIRQLVRDGAIGEVRSLRLIYIWHCHGRYVTTADGRRVTQARRDGRMAEGGPMVDCGVHQIDLARFWLGSEVARWSAAGAWVDDYEAPDHVYLHMDHACGAHTMVEMSYAYCHTVAEPWMHFEYELIGTDGLIRYDRTSKCFEVRMPKGTEALPFGSEKSFPGLYAAFATALETGEPGDLPTGRDGLEATRIARAATLAVQDARLRTHA